MRVGIVARAWSGKTCQAEHYALYRGSLQVKGHSAAGAKHFAAAELSCAGKTSDIRI